MNFKLYPMKIKYQLLFMLLIFSAKSWSQIGGTQVYQFLNLPVNARLAALGGTVLSVKDRDLNMAFQNPAVLNKEMSNQFTFNYNPYFADIKSGYVAYAKHYDSIGTFSAGIQFLKYGEFDQTDATGAVLGTFKASDYSFNIGYGRQLDSNFSVGATLKTIYSSYESYSSVGLAIDLSGNYYNEKKQVCMSLAVRNAGAQLTTYYDGNRESLPFEIAFGISKRLSKAPFRLGLNIVHLEKFDLTYENPNDVSETDPVTGEPVTKTTSGFGKVMLHMIPSLEIIISKNFMVRAAYNIQRRNEMAFNTREGLSGFCFGFGFGIKRFTFNYGRSVYNLAGGSNYLTVSVDLGSATSK